MQEKYFWSLSTLLKPDVLSFFPRSTTNSWTKTKINHLLNSISIQGDKKKKNLSKFQKISNKQKKPHYIDYLSKRRNKWKFK